MSAFLGPIHHWLYKKILFQNGLTNLIVEHYDATDGLGLDESLRAEYGELEQAPLEDIIDETNIHGWLQERVAIVEYRLAAAVTAICEKGPDAMGGLKALAYEFGKENKPAGLNSAREWFACINDTLLDGMPCDRANEIISESDDEAVWQRAVCVHKSYWDAVDGNIGNYYALRDALLEGMVDGSGFAYEKEEADTFHITRRA